ncbi:MAG TPA: glycosyltransferase, partial [Pilimelia sp.]|nr:glycosyltransferase [Pilimelia sp.]
MLVDNGVVGDSRVQKTARSAAERGWDVTLLGRSATGAPQQWRLGDAQVRLLPMDPVLARRRHEFRRAWLRYPLAYPQNGIAAHRAAAVRAWRTDLDFAEARLAAAGADPAARRRARRRIAVARRAATVLDRWVWLRTGMLNRARSRRRFTNPWDRLYTAFWQAVLKERAWRRLEPGLWDYELAYGPVVDELAPDLIHAHDFRMLGVGARAVIRARAAGRRVRLVWDAHEFLPGVKPWRDNARWLPAHCAHESEYAPYADAVVTVSEELGEMLRERHGLPEPPAVVLNAPTRAETAAADAAGGDPAKASSGDTIREACGLGPGVPLVVYSGAATVQRGLDTLIEALPELPGVHVALVV